jgi:hypothetical protein
MRGIIALFIGIAAGVLGYGWWHVTTHATFHVYLADKSAAGRYGQLHDAQLAFLDASGATLARGKTEGKYGTVLVAHPSAGYCGPDLPREAYGACFKAQSEWLVGWVPRLAQVELTVERCRLERVPIKVRAHPDNVLLWWVPLPHVGGKPYTHYSISLDIDSKACAVTGNRG